MSEKFSFLDRDWWKGVFGGIVSTVIGIVLTFGVTAYIDQQNKREMVNKIVLYALDDLAESVDCAKETIESIAFEDSLFTTIWRHRHALSEVDADSLNMFVQALFEACFEFHETESMTKKIFSQNIQVWEFIDDPKVFNRFSDCYTLVEYYEKTMKERQDKKRELVKIFIKERKGNPSSSMASCVEKVLDCKEAFELQVDAKTINMSLSVIVHFAEDILALNKTALGISLKDLDEVHDNYEFVDSTYIRSFIK